jgi:CHRD domain/PEP-CTERM motif
MRKILLAGVMAVSCASVAQAVPIMFDAVLTGAAEDPPNPSPGTGIVLVIYDADLHTLFIDASFSGLVSPTNAAHIHCCTALPGTGTAGVATQVPSFMGFPLGVTAGVFTNMFDLTLASSWNPAFITANSGTPATAEAAFAAGLVNRQTYFNIHTQTSPGGEIRGFLQVVPEPATLTLLGLGLAGLGISRRRRESKSNS